eukprot:CAMPEP_0168345772 /NCGR_PEP_ID=MMETSP0213-20121227/17792_1 /TAXON_ID=151035 /ORGANISM="Euplotes harpa, Strain FSP1.4" /LENGTH=279 /DNA_ID=CAMNT_0008354131 /DNA_START=13 /DNA_END=852 /DNA_ORIENTATION=+
MLNVVHNRTLDLLEYTLSVIEQYDKGYEKLTSVRKSIKSKKEDEKEESKTISRFDDVKARYSQYVVLLGDRAIHIVSSFSKLISCETFHCASGKALDQLSLVTKTRAFVYADELFKLNEKYMKTLEVSSQIFNGLKNKLVVPLSNQIVLIYDFSSKKASLIFESIQNYKVARNLMERFHSAKAVLTSNWLRLDFDEDGKVTIADLINSVKQAKPYVKAVKISEKTQELTSQAYQKAVHYFDCKEPKEPVNLKSDDDDNTCDSIELKPLVEKDDQSELAS